MEYWIHRDTAQLQSQLQRITPLPPPLSVRRDPETNY